MCAAARTYPSISAPQSICSMCMCACMRVNMCACPRQCPSRRMLAGPALMRQQILKTRTPTTPPGPVGLVWPGPIRPFLLLCCAPPTLPPLPHSNRMPPCHGGVHSIFTIYYCYYYYNNYNNYKTKHNCIGPWILGILGEGDHSTHCSRPADIHQIEAFLLLLTTYLLY